MKEETPNKNNQIKSIVGIAIGILVYFLVKQFLFSPLSFDQALIKTSNEINNTCPIMIDKDTRLDNTITLPENIFQYNYSMINNALEEINIEELNSYLEGKLINNIKSNPDMEAFRNNEVTLNYSYSDKDGIFITKISITPDKYK